MPAAPGLPGLAAAPPSPAAEPHGVELLLRRACTQQQQYMHNELEKRKCQQPLQQEMTNDNGSCTACGMQMMGRASHMLHESKYKNPKRRASRLKLQQLLNTHSTCRQCTVQLVLGLLLAGLHR
jgi:hypothetical protein